MKITYKKRAYKNIIDIKRMIADATDAINKADAASHMDINQMHSYRDGLREALALVEYNAGLGTTQNICSRWERGRHEKTNDNS